MTISTTSTAKETKVYKGAHGWIAETSLNDNGGHLWKITTIKGYSGFLSSTAQKMLSENSFMMFGNDEDRKTLIREKGRATEKTIKEQHEKALVLFAEQDQSKEGDKAQELSPIRKGLKFFTWFNTGEVWQVITKIEGDLYESVYLEDLTKRTEHISHIKPYSKKFGIGSYYYDQTGIYGELEYYTDEQISELLKQVEVKKQNEAEAIEKERKDTQNKINNNIDKVVIPSWAKSVIVAELQENDSDPHTDYFNSVTVKTIFLGFSSHTKRSFAELQKACKNCPETAHLSEKDRKDIFCTYRMRIEEAAYSGWHVSKDTYDFKNDNFKNRLALAMAEDRYFIPEETKKEKTSFNPVEPVEAEGVEMVQYNERCFALFGDTKPYKDQLGRKGLKCLFNGRLTNPKTGQKQAGWIVNNNKVEVVKQVLNIC